MTKTNIKDIICPDGKRRTFWTNGTASNGRPRGYVQVNGVSVSGYAKSVGRGYHFLPNPKSKNLHLIRPATLVVGTRVELDNGYYGTIVGVEWNYLKAEYVIQPDKIKAGGNHVRANS